MATNFIRFRYFIIGVLLMAGYFIYNQASLMRVFHRHYNFYFVGYVVTLILFAYSGQIMGWAKRIGWTIVCPLVGSIIGYIFVAAHFYSEYGYFTKLSILDWIFVAVVNAYFMAKLWILSFTFLVACVIDYALMLRIKN
ncbi:MAG: hypothetical protein RL748_2605 [Pseudomonadota bacterium]|jgi:hypothetical protein